MPLRAPIQALLHDVKVDLAQLRGLDRGTSILEEGGQDLPEVVLPFVGFDIDDGQVEVKQDRLDRHLEDHTPAYLRGSLFYPRDAFDQGVVQVGVRPTPGGPKCMGPTPVSWNPQIECATSCRGYSSFDGHDRDGENWGRRRSPTRQRYGRHGPKQHWGTGGDPGGMGNRHGMAGSHGGHR